MESLFHPLGFDSSLLPFGQAIRFRFTPATSGSRWSVLPAECPQAGRFCLIDFEFASIVDENCEIPSGGVSLKVPGGQDGV